MASRHLALVADPNEETALRLEPVLSELGLELLPARDGEEALRLIDRRAPHLVLAEASLGLDGYALCARLREGESTRAIPIVLIGEQDDRAGRMAALEAGADDFLSKPLVPREVKLRLAGILRRSRLHSGPNGKGPRAPSASAPDAAAAPGRREDYEKVVARVQNAIDAVERGETPRLGPIRDSARFLIEETDRSPDLLNRALGKRDLVDLAAHHVNVAIFSLAIARELGGPPEDLEKLAFVALVHDLGMIRVPASIRYAERNLSPAEFQQITRHPRETYEILIAAGEDYREIAEIAYQEHEREKGQGYPRGLKGQEIHPLAKILGVADVYEACTHPRSYKKTFIPYEALQELIEMRGEFFPHRYIKALMNALTVYPIGSYVVLNTGEIGRVRATNRKNLLRPVVEVLWSARGQKLTPTKRIDLSENPFLFVTRPLYEDQLPSA